MIKIFILSLTFITQGAYAKEALTVGCKNNISKELLAKEQEYLAVTFIQPTAEVRAWYKGQTLMIRAKVFDAFDGRSVVYSAETTSLIEEDICEFTFERKTELQCRYSNEAFENEVIKEVSSISLGAEANFSPIEQAQLSIVFGDESDQISLKEQIKNKDDSSVIKTVYLMPDGSNIDYWEYGSGDNGFGTFFLKDSASAIGQNTDSDYCIDYSVK